LPREVIALKKRDRKDSDACAGAQQPGKEQRDVERYREAAYRAVDQPDWLDNTSPAFSKSRIADVFEKNRKSSGKRYRL
jgi:hypothetical protein